MIEDIQSLLSAIATLNNMQANYRKTARKNPYKVEPLKQAIMQARDSVKIRAQNLQFRLDNTQEAGFHGTIARHLLALWNNCQYNLALWKAEPNPDNLRCLRDAEERLRSEATRIRITIEKVQ